MAPYYKESRVLLKADAQDVWNFFSNPNNLQRLTPKNFGFKHRLAPDAEHVYAGMLLSYRVSPMLGIPLHWLTEITHVEAPHRFVDEQRAGPFALWHHIHEFQAQAAGTLVIDKLYYQMPLGLLGRAAHALFAERQIASIFTYRRQALSGLFEVAEL